MNDQLGTRTEQGVVWPLFTIHGHTYDRQLATVLNFDSQHFAVVGMGEAIDADKIKALQATLVPPAPVIPPPLQGKKDREVKDGGNDTLPLP